jgi:fucose permease
MSVRSSFGLLVALSGFAFVSLGLPDGLVGVAWPSIARTFRRDVDDLGLLLVATTVGYVVLSTSSARLFSHLNLGVVLAVSCALTAGGLAGYSVTPQWWWLLPLSALLGLGGGGIDAALNTYVASHHGARTLNLLHACYGVGAAVGPLIMTMVMRADRPWQRGYAIVAVGQLLLGSAFLATARRWPHAVASHSEATARLPLRDTLGLSVARLGALTFVIYAGVEASLGAWAFTLLTLGRGLEPAAAGVIVSVYWGGLTAGRLVAATIGDRLAPRVMLRGSIAAVAIGTFGLWLNAGTIVTQLSIALAGLACGPVFPTLVALTPQRVGTAHVANAVGLQLSAAAVSVSIVPALIGTIAAAAGIEMIATLLLGLSVLLVVIHHRLDRSRTA